MGSLSRRRAEKKVEKSVLQAAPRDVRHSPRHVRPDSLTALLAGPWRPEKLLWFLCLTLICTDVSPPSFLPRNLPHFSSPGLSENQ